MDNTSRLSMNDAKSCIPLETALALANFCIANAEKGAQTT